MNPSSAITYLPEPQFPYLYRRIVRYPFSLLQGLNKVTHRNYLDQGSAKSSVVAVNTVISRALQRARLLRSSHLFGDVRGAGVHTDEALLVAAAATPEHVHTGRLEERVGAPPQLAGHLHARLSGAALGSLPFFIYNCRQEAHWGSSGDGPAMPMWARLTQNTVVFTFGGLIYCSRWRFFLSVL